MRDDPSGDSRIAEVLRAIPASSRWAFAEEALLEAVRHEARVKRGPRGTRLTKIMDVAAACRLATAAIACVGAWELGRLVLRHPRHGRVPGSGHTRDHAEVCVFVGFGARMEDSLFEAYRTRQRGAVIRVNQTDPAVSDVACRPTVGVLIRCFREALSDIRRGLGRIPAACRTPRADFATSMAMKVGGYVYAKAWWRRLRRQHTVSEACFITADVHAFAALSEGVRSAYCQHGLLSRNLSFPAFHAFRMLTHYEMAYLRERQPAATLSVVRDMVVPEPKARESLRLLIASESRPPKDLNLVIPLVHALMARGVAVHVRPASDDVLSPLLRSQVDGRFLHVESSTGPFADVLDRLEPAFVAAWGSTTLVDALYRGIIPISVADPQDPRIGETLFPLFRCCLRWPQDQALIEQALGCPETYVSTVRRLQAQAVFPAAVA